MATPFVDQFVELRRTINAWQIFGTFIAVAFFGFILLFLKHAISRRRISQKLPGRKLRFVDILGNLSDMPLSKEKSHGWSFNVCWRPQNWDGTEKNRTVSYMMLKAKANDRRKDLALCRDEFRGPQSDVTVDQMLEGYYRLFQNTPLFCFWVSYVPFIILTKAEAVEALISGTKFMEKNWSYNWLQPWLGTGLLTSHGSKWKSRRKLLTPSFHFEILKDFLPVFNEQSKVLVKRLRKETVKDSTDIVMPITLCSLDIMCETTLGVSVGAQENTDSQYVKSVTRAGEIIMERMLSSWYWFDFLFNFMEKGKELNHHINILHNFTLGVIQEKKRKLMSGDPNIDSKRKRMALMDLLLEHHIRTRTLTEEDIREEVDTFAFEGHDTTAMGMSWALYMIGLHKDVQNKIHEELDRIFGDDIERPVETDDLKDMKYLECVLKESQRLYPSVPLIARRITEDTTICGYSVPKDSSCIVAVYLLHKDPSVFPVPEKFDPDRFLPENSIDRKPFAYIPFSAGPRNCIGQRFAIMEEKVIVSSILRNYTIESLDQRDKIPPAPELILRSSTPIRIRIRPREKHNS